MKTLVALLSVLIFSAAGVAHAQYRYKRISDWDALGINAGETAINEHGRVAFSTVKFLPNKFTLYTGNGGPVTKIADTLGPLEVDRLWAPDINRWGTVAFKSHLDQPGVLESHASGLFKGNGTSFSTVARYDNGAFLTDAAFNDRGHVASVVTWPGGVSSVVAYTPQKQTIATFNDPANTFGEPDINNLGILAFPIKTPTEERIVMTAGDKLVTRVTTKGTNIARLIDSEPRINDLGAIAFRADLKSGGQGVFLSDHRGLRMIADTSGPYLSLGSPALNNRGEVVFTAGTDISVTGVYRGPDPIADRVIGPGDLLDGKPVQYANVSSRGLNDSGQIAFWAMLSTEVDNVFRADPITLQAAVVPEPSQLGLITTMVTLIAVRRGGWSRG